MSAYSEASKAVFRVFEDTSPLVEGLSIDEAFLDVRGMERIAGTPTEIAVRLRREVLEQVGLPITVGVARTKFLAKVASAVAKPNGLLVVPPDGELSFLHPLPVERIWGVGPVTARKLHERGITVVGEVAELAESLLVLWLGPAAGRKLHALAHNRDPRRVHVGRRRGSIGSQRALGWSPKSHDVIDASLVALVDRVTRRMRAAGRVGRTVVLRLRFDDFSRATRSHTLPHATSHTQTVLDTARALLATAMPMIERQGLTLIGVAVAQPRQRRRRPADAAARSPQRQRPRCRTRRDPRPLRDGSDHPRRAARPRPGPDGADAARLSLTARTGDELPVRGSTRRTAAGSTVVITRSPSGSTATSLTCGPEIRVDRTPSGVSRRKRAAGQGRTGEIERSVGGDRDLVRVHVPDDERGAPTGRIDAPDPPGVQTTPRATVTENGSAIFGGTARTPRSPLTPPSTRLRASTGRAPGAPPSRGRRREHPERASALAELPASLARRRSHAARGSLAPSP